MEKDKIKVSVIIDKKALIDRAFKNAETPDEFNEIKLIILDSSEFVRDATQIEDKKKQDAHNEVFCGIALDEILKKYNQTKMALRMEKAKEELENEKAKAKEAYENLKKKLGENNPLVSALCEIFNEEEG